MLAADPLALAIGLGLAAGPGGALLVRRGRRFRGVLLGGLLGAAAGLAAAALGAQGDRFSLAACALIAGAITALALPGFGLASFRRRSFGSAFGRAAFTGAQGCAALPERLAAQRPSRLLDAADRLRLESALAELEPKTGAMLSVALVAQAGVHEGARWRAAVWAGGLGLAAVAAAGAPAIAGLAAAAAGLLAGGTFARSAHVGRFACSEAELDAASSQGALDAFAHAGLLHAPAANGLLIFAALFERRVVVLADRGLSAQIAGPIARAAAEGLTAKRPLEGLLASLAPLVGGEKARAVTAARPLPVRVED